MSSATSANATSPSLDSYEDWLVKNRYQRSTVVVTLRNLRLIYADVMEGSKLGENAIPHVRRYLRFVAETRKNPLGREFYNLVRKDGIEPSSDTEKHGRRSKKLLDLKSWSGLKARLRRGEETDLLIVAFMNSGLRIGAFLELRADKITTEVTDKISRDWLRKAGGTKPLYAILCDTERCAYARMLRRLQEVYGPKVDLDTLYKTHQASEAKSEEDAKSKTSEEPSESAAE